MNEVPGTWYPIGTLDEVKELGLDPKTTFTCSLQGQTNRGCPWFSKCRFREIRDRATPKGHKVPLKGPETVAVYVQLSPSNGGMPDIKRPSCFDYYVSGLHNRYKNMEESGEVVKVLGIAGDGREYTQMDSVKAHFPKDPNCPDCATNTCIRMKSRKLRTVLEKFPRPNEVYGQLATGSEIREEVLREMREEYEREMLNFDPSDPLADEVKEPEKVVTKKD